MGGESRERTGSSARFVVRLSPEAGRPTTGPPVGHNPVAPKTFRRGLRGTLLGAEALSRRLMPPVHVSPADREKGPSHRPTRTPARSRERAGNPAESVPKDLVSVGAAR